MKTGPVGIVPEPEDEWEESEPRGRVTANGWITAGELKERHQALMLIVLQWFGLLTILALAGADLINVVIHAVS